MGNSADSIFMHLMEEYVMRSYRYTTLKSHCKVVPNVYIGCIGDLCHIPVVDPCYVFQRGLCALWVLHARSVD